MSDTLTVDDTRSPSVSQLWWSVLAFGLPFFLYLRTMAPTVYGLDSAELTTGAYVLGIVHAPGSPLYLLLGHLFTWLPIGDVGYRLNLLSGCAAALAILFVYLILHHLTGRHLLSLAGAWFLAFSYYFWISAVAAELYALHVCFVAGLIFLTVKWRESEHAWQLYLLAFLFGLGLGNHLSLILMAPGFAWLALLTRNRAWRHPRLLLIAAVCGIVGAAIYLYIPLRFVSDTPLNYARDYWQVNLASWNGFWWMVTGKLFESMFFAVPVAQVPHELRVYAHDLWSNFVGLGIMLGVIGLVAGFRRQPILHTGLLLMFAGHLLFFLGYVAPDKGHMFLPTYLLWGLWVALGANVLSDYAQHKFKAGWVFSGATLLFLMAAGNLALNLSYVDISDDASARVRGEKILAALAPNAVYMGTWKDIPILEYLQIVERRRPDVTTANMHFIGRRGAQRLGSKTLAAGYPVYTSWHELIDDGTFEFRYSEACGCYQLTSAVHG